MEDTYIIEFVAAERAVDDTVRRTASGLNKRETMPYHTIQYMSLMTIPYHIIPYHAISYIPYKNEGKGK
jgi:hypothetical protein